jgi:hypothetical protein
LALVVFSGVAAAQDITVHVTDSVLVEVRDDVYGIQYHAHTFNDPGALAKLDPLPLTGVRIWAYPSEFHPEPGRWNWDALDNAIAEVVNAGYTPWLCLFQAEDWYTGSPEDPWWNDDTAWTEWTMAARALADRYGDVVDRWIVFDEVNYLHADRPYYMSLEASVALFLEAARTIRSVDDHAQIGGPSGFAGWENGYWAVRVLDEEGGADLLDFISSNLFLSWNADDSDAHIMDRTIWYEEAPLKIKAMLGETDDPSLILDAYNASALWTRDGTAEGELWTDPRNVNTFGGVYQTVALLHSLRGGFDVTLRWETLGGFGILSWFPAFRELPPYYAWRLLTEQGRLRPGNALLHTTTTETPLEDLPHHSGQNVAGYSVQPFAVRGTDGQSVVLINKYAGAKEVTLTAPHDAMRYGVYRFDEDRHVAALEPLLDVREGVVPGELIPLSLPGLSVTVVAFYGDLATNSGSVIPPQRQSRLLPIEPNPFRATTRIPIELALNDTVELSVFSARGHRVATLASRTMPAGLHTFTFDATVLSAGIYFCQLCTSAGCTSRPMVHIR